MRALTHLTVDDFVRAGACRSGIEKAMVRLFRAYVTQVTVEEAILAEEDGRVTYGDLYYRSWINSAAELDGNGEAQLFMGCCDFFALGRDDFDGEGFYDTDDCGDGLDGEGHYDVGDSVAGGLFAQGVGQGKFFQCTKEDTA